MRGPVALELGVPIGILERGLGRGPDESLVGGLLREQFHTIKRGLQAPAGLRPALLLGGLRVHRRKGTRQNQPVRVMSPDEWQPLAVAHAAQVDAWSEGKRTRQGERHPIDDFLWHYYSFRPSHLRRWHPGSGIGLLDADEHATWPHYVTRDGVTFADVDSIGDRRRALVWMRDLLARTLAREPRLGCFALHEWAMVYGLEQQEVRHEQAPLRLSPGEIRAVVDRSALRCTHYDAFRFYTPGAAPLNELAPTRDNQIDMEQPGCLHANMDIYKWAYKSTPFISSALTRDAFALAREIRLLDVQASPYDLSAWGTPSLDVETQDGRVEFIARQRDFTERANALRVRLIAELDAVLAPVA